MKYTIKQALLCSFFVGIMLAFPVWAQGHQLNPVRVYVFHSLSCPHCQDELEYLENLEESLPHVEVVDFEVSRNFRNQSLFSNVLEEYQLEGAVPVTVVGDVSIVGYDNEKGIGREVLEMIKNCSLNRCESRIDQTYGELPQEKIEVKKETLNAMGITAEWLEHFQETVDQTDTNNQGFKQGNEVKVFGLHFDPESQSSTFIIGVILGLADGINPCMFSVLLFLLTYLIAIGSRKKALHAGLIFAVTTFGLYFLFMLGIIRVVDILGIAYWFRLVVIAFAVVAGLLMIKDFFFYGKGISLEIPKRYRPTIQTLIKRGTLPSAFVLAIFAGVVELPCTSGLPLAYVTILADRDLNPAVYLLVYNFFFILPLLLIIASVVFAWKKSEQIEEKRLKMRKYMRLLAGIMLLLLALALWNNWI